MRTLKTVVAILLCLTLMPILSVLTVFAEEPATVPAGTVVYRQLFNKSVTKVEDAGLVPQNHEAFKKQVTISSDGYLSASTLGINNEYYRIDLPKDLLSGSKEYTYQITFRYADPDCADWGGFQLGLGSKYNVNMRYNQLENGKGRVDCYGYVVEPALINAWKATKNGDTIVPGAWVTAKVTVKEGKLDTTTLSVEGVETVQTFNNNPADVGETAQLFMMVFGSSVQIKEILVVNSITDTPKGNFLKVNWADVYGNAANKLAVKNIEVSASLRTETNDAARMPRPTDLFDFSDFAYSTGDYVVNDKDKSGHVEWVKAELETPSKIGEVRFFAPHNYTITVVGNTIQASVDGETWEDIGVIERALVPDNGVMVKLPFNSEKEYKFVRVLRTVEKVGDWDDCPWSLGYLAVYSKSSASETEPEPDEPTVHTPVDGEVLYHQIFNTNLASLADAGVKVQDHEAFKATVKRTEDGTLIMSSLMIDDAAYKIYFPDVLAENAKNYTIQTTFRFLNPKNFANGGVGLGFGDVSLLNLNYMKNFGTDGTVDAYTEKIPSALVEEWLAFESNGTVFPGSWVTVRMTVKDGKLFETYVTVQGVTTTATLKTLTGEKVIASPADLYLSVNRAAVEVKDLYIVNGNSANYIGGFKGTSYSDVYSNAENKLEVKNITVSTGLRTATNDQFRMPRPTDLFDFSDFSYSTGDYIVNEKAGHDEWVMAELVTPSKIGEVRFFCPHNYTITVNGNSIQASVDGENWDDIGKVLDPADNGAMVKLTFSGEKEYKYIRVLRTVKTVGSWDDCPWSLGYVALYKEAQPAFVADGAYVQENPDNGENPPVGPDDPSKDTTGDNEEQTTKVPGGQTTTAPEKQTTAGNDTTGQPDTSSAGCKSAAAFGIVLMICSVGAGVALTRKKK